MLQTEQVEELICLISAMDRNALAALIQNYRATFPVDFTPEFLSQQPVERLRHLFLAVCLQSQRMPTMERDLHAPTAA
jgi:hypothetical protein